MSWMPFKKEPTDLETAIKDVHARMREIGPGEEEYRKLIVFLDRLEAMKTGDRQNRISRDTMLQVAGSLLGILIIVAYEREHVMASKALGFVWKKKA